LKRGFVLAVIEDGKSLSLVVYEAAAEHYFDTYADEAEAILATIRVI
jgi:hypothetical protein